MSDVSPPRGMYRTHLARDGIESFSYDGPASYLGRHAHDELQLTLYDGGPHRFEVAGAETLGAPHCAVLVPAGEMHSSRPAGANPIRLRGFYIAHTVLESLAESLWQGRETIAFRQPIIDDPGTIEELRFAHSHLARDEVGAEERLTTALATLLKRCALPRGTLRRMPSARSNVERVRDYLHAAVLDDVTLDALADVAELSRYHLIRAFRDAFGMTPFAYQRRLRVQRARTVLARGGDISEAVAAGRFADRSHFGRLFRACYGVSPGIYRASFPRRIGTSP